jgi:hypothetical protein
MVRKLFTERVAQPEPRVKETLENAVQIALLQLVEQRIDDCSFGMAFPAQCPDGTANSGVNTERLKAVMEGYRVIWPRDALVREDLRPSDPQVFDLLEFTYEHVALPIQNSYHSFFQHHHFGYDQGEGRRQFAAEVNRLFERNGIAYQLHDGQVERLVPTVLQEVLLQPTFNTRDQTLDELLQAAREKFLNRDLAVRREALEKLWDAWERLKSLSDPNDKRHSVEMLLDRASAEPNLRGRIDAEARQLTEIGNNFMIRHTEVTKTPITESIHVDYLFHRLFSLIRMLLQANGIKM